MYSLEGKIAVITGAAQGMGAAKARLFIQQGAKVVLTDVKESGSAVADELGDRAIFVAHDVAQEDQWTNVINIAIARFGNVNILINNAGVYRPVPLQGTDAALMDYHYRVNQLGVFFGIKAVLESMKAAGGGAIVNISSQAGLQGHPGMFAYTASKWASRGMTRAAAAELAAYNIRVNSVHPGAINTPMLGVVSPEMVEAYTAMIPLKRFGSAEEVAQMVLYLASDASAYVTGAEFAIAGGLGA
jgi:3alpha(or 20beta)-hydroxysteroid dehydrogenase